MNHPNFATIATHNNMITNSINQAVNLLQNENVVAIPTETVYGLAGNIFSEIAIKKIFEIKKRPSFNPLIVHLDSIHSLEKVAKNIPKEAYLLANHFWPGPLTMIFEKQDTVSKLVTGGKDTVAVRIPNHPVALELLKKVGFPLAAPSANPFKSISPTLAKHVEKYFEKEQLLILDGGECQKGIESTIIGFDKEGIVLYRLGSLAVESIEKVVGPVKFFINEDLAPIAPGMLSRHYAPATPFILTANLEEILEKNQGKKIGIIRFQEEWVSDSHHVEILSKSGNLEEATRKLYAILHQLDEMDLDLIIAEAFPNYDLGKSINDRLGRASKSE